MMVMTMSLKLSELKAQTADNKNSKKSLEKCRPITATLDRPLILDIKLLQKLDMTTFTKRGLIALSKFCGISLISKNVSKTKLNQCIKAIQGSYKLTAKSDSNGDNGSDSGNEKKDLDSKLAVPKEKTIAHSGASDNAKFKRSIKPNISKHKPQVHFKIIELETGQSNVEETEGEETAAAKEEKAEKEPEVNCNSNKEMKVCKSIKPKSNVVKKPKENAPFKKKVLIKIHNPVIEIVPEPCKSCTRKQLPERLHSHPKFSNRGILEKKRFDERIKTCAKGKDVADEGSIQKNQGKTIAKNKNLSPESSISLQKTISNDIADENEDSHCNEDSKGKSTGKLKSEETKTCTKASSNTPNKRETTVQITTNKKSGGGNDITENQKLKFQHQNDARDEPGPSTTESFDPSTKPSSESSGEDDVLKYVTGCYVCGAQVTPQSRMQHEKDCIGEWRSQNSVLPPEERKLEPQRPDYRFTASGDVDLNGTFESIWENHMDSLVPCKFCGRKFFPDRIEKHENCCDKLSLRIKFKH